MILAQHLNAAHMVLRNAILAHANAIEAEKKIWQELRAISDVEKNLRPYEKAAEAVRLAKRDLDIAQVEWEHLQAQLLLRDIETRRNR